MTVDQQQKEEGWTMSMMLRLPRILFFLLFCSSTIGEPLNEEERIAEYEKRNYVWPIPEVNPNTPGWDRLMRRRIKQVAQIEDLQDRYNAYVALMPQALVAQNFTENGWGLTRAPKDLVEKLKASLYDNFDSARAEYVIPVIHGNEREGWESPLFIDQESLNSRILKGLKSMHEEWAGVPLIGEIAYGLRIYRNQSILNMHGT
jgi:hypothetical protein